MHNFFIFLKKVEPAEAEDQMICQQYQVRTWWNDNTVFLQVNGEGEGKNRSATKFRKNAPQVGNFLNSFVQDCSFNLQLLILSGNVIS